jgi:hypothetical protein
MVSWMPRWRATISSTPRVKVANRFTKLASAWNRAPNAAMSWVFQAA